MNENIRNAEPGRLRGRQPELRGRDAERAVDRGVEGQRIVDDRPSGDRGSRWRMQWNVERGEPIDRRVVDDRRCVIELEWTAERAAKRNGGRDDRNRDRPPSRRSKTFRLLLRQGSRSLRSLEQYRATGGRHDGSRSRQRSLPSHVAGHHVRRRRGDRNSEWIDREHVHRVSHVL